MGNAIEHTRTETATEGENLPGTQRMDTIVSAKGEMKEEKINKLERFIQANDYDALNNYMCEFEDDMKIHTDKLIGAVEKFDEENNVPQVKYERKMLGLCMFSV
jgi:hypothetical protein